MKKENLKKSNENVQEKLMKEIKAKKKELKETINWLDDWDDYDQKSILYEQIIRISLQLINLNRRLRKVNIQLFREKTSGIKEMAK